MNILFTVFSLNVGGIERLLVDIVEHWQNRGDNIHVCIINKDYNIELINELKNLSHVNLLLLDRPIGGNIFEYLVKYLNYIKKNKIKVIHCQSINVVKFSILAKILNSKIKLIHTIHDTNTYINYTLTNILLDKIFTTKLIAISNSVRDEILFRNINKNKVELVFNGIDFSKFKCNRKNELRYEIKLGCVARIDYKKKGQDLLIRAVTILKNKYPNIKCYFAGEVHRDKQDDLKYLKELVKKYNLEENVEFLGNINDVNEFLNNIDVFVLPSRFEGFGISVVEAIATKLPIVVSDIDGPREIVAQCGYGYLFEKNNYIELAEQIELAITNNDKVKIEESYLKAKEEYDINSMIDKLRIIYK